MALKQRDTRRMVSHLARQMNFPSEHNERGQPNWRGGEGRTTSAMMKLLTASCSANTVHDALRRTHAAFMDGNLDGFDAGDAPKAQKPGMEDFEIMLAIRNLHGCDLTAMVANELRDARVPAKPRVSRSTLRTCCKSWGLQCHRRQSRSRHWGQELRASVGAMDVHVRRPAAAPV